MKTTVLFAKITLSMLAFYVYICFAFAGALKGITYPPSDTATLASQTEPQKELLAAKTVKPATPEKAGFIN